MSAHGSGCDGCLPGCPLVFDHILPTHPTSVARQFPAATKTIPTCGSDHGQASGPHHRHPAPGHQSIARSRALSAHACECELCQRILLKDLACSFVIDNSTFIMALQRRRQIRLRGRQEGTAFRRSGGLDRRAGPPDVRSGPISCRRVGLSGSAATRAGTASPGRCVFLKRVADGGGAVQGTAVRPGLIEGCVGSAGAQRGQNTLRRAGRVARRRAASRCPSPRAARWRQPTRPDGALRVVLPLPQGRPAPRGSRPGSACLPPRPPATGPGAPGPQRRSGPPSA